MSESDIDDEIQDLRGQLNFHESIIEALLEGLFDKDLTFKNNSIYDFEDYKLTYSKKNHYPKPIYVFDIRTKICERTGGKFSIQSGKCFHLRKNK